MDNKTLTQRIIKEAPSPIALSILLRGFVTCDNYRDIPPQMVLLLTGINPSFDPYDHSRNEWGLQKGLWPGETRSFKITEDLQGPFWNNKRRDFNEVWDDIAYLDLFPIRETDQSLFENAFKDLTEIRSKFLSITQDAIEEMHPRLIVHANKDSMYYWGIKKNTPIGEMANDEVNPWMGYRVRRVTPEVYPDIHECMRLDNRLELFPLYEIVGFVDSENRINRQRFKKTTLEGSFLMEYVMDGRNKKYAGKLYKPKEWKDIWSWVKKHFSDANNAF